MRTRDRPRREALQVYGIFVWYATRFHACPVLPERALVVWASAVGCGPVCACVVCVCLIVRARECIYVGPHERVLLPTLAPHFAWARASQARRVRGNGAGYHVRSRGRLPGCPLARAALGAAHDHMLNVDVCRVCCLFCVHPWMCGGVSARCRRAPRLS